MQMLLAIIIFFLSASNYVPANITKTPVIYVSDLTHPHGDPDDTFDLATIYSIPNIDVRGIVLDQVTYFVNLPPGGISVDQINYLSGRHVPYAIGLKTPLASLTDTGTNQAAEYQGGVQLIIDQLTSSKEKVNLITVGSLRDIAAAYNRNSQLFKDKVDKIMVFAGEATANFQENNVGLDLNAYLDIMRSGLNIYWVPCFDGGLWHNDNGLSSYHYVDHQGSLLDGIDNKLLQYFTYSLNNKTSDPISYLSSEVNQTEKSDLYKETRNVWAGNIIESITGVYDKSVYDFKLVNVSFDSIGAANYNQIDSKVMMRFEIVDKTNFKTSMTKRTNEILKNFHPIK